MIAIKILLASSTLVTKIFVSSFDKAECFFTASDFVFVC